MNKDMIILLKSIYKNGNDRNHHILKLDEIVAAFKQNKLKVEQIMVVEEGFLKDKVSKVKLNIFCFLWHCSFWLWFIFVPFQIKKNHAKRLCTFLMGGMVVLLSGGIVLALPFSLVNDNQIEHGLNNGTVSSSRKGTESLWKNLL